MTVADALEQARAREPVDAAQAQALVNKLRADAAEPGRLGLRA